MVRQIPDLNYEVIRWGLSFQNEDKRYLRSEGSCFDGSILHITSSYTVLLWHLNIYVCYEWFVLTKTFNAF